MINNLIPGYTATLQELDILGNKVFFKSLARNQEEIFKTLVTFVLDPIIFFKQLLTG